MNRPEAESEKRPERVIVLDADDPMVEIEGRIVWQEEHERIVDQVRQQGYADGYAAAKGDRDAEASRPIRIELRSRHTLGNRVKLAILILGLICLLLALPVLVFS